MRYQITCDGTLLGIAHDADIAQAIARYHAKIADLLDWQEDPNDSRSVVAVLNNRVYKVSVLPIGDRPQCV